MKKLHALFICLIASTLVSCSTTPERPQAVMSTPVPRVVQPAAPAPLAGDPQLAELERLAPDADPGVLALALEARSCALKSGKWTATRASR